MMKWCQAHARRKMSEAKKRKTTEYDAKDALSGFSFDPEPAEEWLGVGVGPGWLDDAPPVEN